MSVYYIEAKVDSATVLYTLDATTDIAYSLVSSISSHPVENGSNISDNIFNQNKTVSFSGFISDVKSITNQTNMPTKDYIEGLEKIRDEKILFTLYFSSNLAPLPNCFFESVDIEQGGDQGSIETDTSLINSFKVKLAIKQLRLVDAAVKSTITSDELANQTTTEENAPGATSFADPSSTDESLFQRGQDNWSTGFSTFTGQQ